MGQNPTEPILTRPLEIVVFIVINEITKNFKHIKHIVVTIVGCNMILIWIIHHFLWLNLTKYKLVYENLLMYAHILYLLTKLMKV